MTHHKVVGSGLSVSGTVASGDDSRPSPRPKKAGGGLRSALVESAAIYCIALLCPLKTSCFLSSSSGRRIIDRTGDTIPSRGLLFCCDCGTICTLAFT